MDTISGGVAGHLIFLSGSLFLSWAMNTKGEPVEMGKLRKLLSLVLIGTVISLGGFGCEKKEAAPVETPAKETKAGESEEKEKPAAEHPKGAEHPAGEKEHPAGEKAE